MKQTENLLVSVRNNLHLRWVMPVELCLTLTDYASEALGEEDNLLDFNPNQEELFAKFSDLLLPEIESMYLADDEKLAVLSPVIRRYSLGTSEQLRVPRQDAFAQYAAHLFLQRAEEGGNIYVPSQRYSSKIVPEGWAILHETQTTYGISRVKQGEAFLLSFWFRSLSEGSEHMGENYDH